MDEACWGQSGARVHSGGASPVLGVTMAPGWPMDGTGQSKPIGFFSPQIRNFQFPPLLWDEGQIPLPTGPDSPTDSPLYPSVEGSWVGRGAGPNVRRDLTVDKGFLPVVTPQQG